MKEYALGQLLLFASPGELPAGYEGQPVLTASALLAVRVAEVGALDQLAGMNKTEEFLKAAGDAAVRPLKAAGDMAAHPDETVKGVPAAVGRFFDRVELGAKRLAASASSPSKTSEEKAVDVTNRVGGITAAVVGYEQERRELALRRQLQLARTGVDARECASH